MKILILCCQTELIMHMLHLAMVYRRIAQKNQSITWRVIKNLNPYTLRLWSSKIWMIPMISNTKEIFQLQINEKGKASTFLIKSTKMKRTIASFLKDLHRFKTMIQAKTNRVTILIVQHKKTKTSKSLKEIKISIVCMKKNKNLNQLSKLEISHRISLIIR